VNRKRARHMWSIARQGPTEAAYGFLRARRRRRNLPDDELELDASDARVLEGGWDLTAAQVAANAAEVEAQLRGGAREVRTVQWFIPWFHLVHGGGPYTLMRIADHLAREHGVANRFCVFDRSDAGAASDIAGKIGGAFPALAAAPVTAGAPGPEPADAAIATSWPSALELARYDGAAAKFFLVQDWEPDFFPAGSASAVLEGAARLGIPGIVNTPGLADSYRAAGAPAVSFTPAVDTRLYTPASGPRGAGRIRIFFYGRPASPRNAFGLGLAALREVKRRHGDAVEIVSAGEDWSEGQYGVADVLENRGMLEDIEAVARLYRSCDIGLVFMLTRHPSYLPLELMASGAATVSNRNPHTEWLLRHEDNALLAEPFPSLVADQVGRLVEDRELREAIVQAGLREVRARRWENELERVWGALTGAGPQFTREPETG
jgi:glycosyltransferase involved in cell wall biosynthesis